VGNIGCKGGENRKDASLVEELQVRSLTKGEEGKEEGEEKRGALNKKECC